MIIKRLQLDIEFSEGSMHVFHTDGLMCDEPPTTIRINDQEFIGSIEYYESSGVYEIKITKIGIV